MTGSEKLLEEARRLATDARSQSEFENALRVLKSAAKAGNAEAHYAIGTWYLFGRVVPKDPRKAAPHLKYAAKRGVPSAQFDLAILYETGRGVAKDKKRAFALYVQSAQNGDRDAIDSVVRCLYHGIGVARSKLVSDLIADFAAGGINFAPKELRRQKLKSTRNRATR
jgi:TPR repeat protein